MSVEKYTAAIETHKFYDTISISIVAGQIAISGAAFFIYKEIKNTPVDWVIFLITAACVLFLLSIYRHCAYYANVARNVAADLEQGKEIHGVSFAYQNGMHRAEKKWWRGIYGCVHFLSFTLIGGLLFSAMVVSNA